MIDHGARHVRMVGKGREQGGAGSAETTVESWVTELDQGAKFVVEADVKLRGRMVRFGRGMIERVAKEVFTEFATRLEEKLRNEQDSKHAEVRAEEGTDPSASKLAPDTSLNLLPLLRRAFRSWTARTFRRGET